MSYYKRQRTLFATTIVMLGTHFVSAILKKLTTDCVLQTSITYCDAYFERFLWKTKNQTIKQYKLTLFMVTNTLYL